MAVKLRLTRLGRKKKPFYRIIAVDSRAPRDGRYLENLGYYDPLPDPFEFKINEERVLYWLGVGAIPSHTVRSLLRREGILFKWDLQKRGLSEEQMEQEMKRYEVIQLERRRKVEKKLEEKAKLKVKEEKEKGEEKAKAEDKDAAPVADGAEGVEAAAEEKAPDQTGPSVSGDTTETVEVQKETPKEEVAPKAETEKTAEEPVDVTAQQAEASTEKTEGSEESVDGSEEPEKRSEDAEEPKDKKKE